MYRDLCLSTLALTEQFPSNQLRIQEAQINIKRVAMLQSMGKAYTRGLDARHTE